MVLQQLNMVFLLLNIFTAFMHFSLKKVCKYFVIKIKPSILSFSITFPVATLTLKNETLPIKSL